MNKRSAEIIFVNGKWLVDCYSNGIFVTESEFDTFFLALGSAREYIESGEIVSLSVCDVFLDLGNRELISLFGLCN
ncbi:hypothetical protein [Neisseria meningitidis]|uniref:hypothetical protein n=1 Tax=Neisseria meningitidis TaxID=487 RepID=UPI000330A915|nr:hypothetical protein [Neisseria meningitidis]EOB60881.1 hypothetical protein NM63023_1197 [Neisseria meningitidis 63023]EOB61088.1 hypothetical protein NM63023_1163 [Neisseria meningitidis 63023]EOB61540.1 hypothetical protein NM63023_0989 [Neisseria meningitidis 63023]